MVKRIYFVLILFTFLGCQNPNERLDCQKIDFIGVYYLPFGISSPTGGLTQDSIKDLDKKEVDNEQKIQKICDRTSQIKELKDVDFMDTKVHLRADFVQDKKEVLTILSDGNIFKIGRRIYELDTELLNLLIK